MGYLSALITLSPSEKVARTSNWVTSLPFRNAAGKEFEMDFGMLAKPSWFSHTSSLKTATTASATPALSSDPAFAVRAYSNSLGVANSSRPELAIQACDKKA